MVMYRGLWHVLQKASTSSRPMSAGNEGGKSGYAPASYVAPDSNMGGIVWWMRPALCSE